MFNVVFEFFDGNWKKFGRLLGKIGMFVGVGFDEGKFICKVWVKFGFNNSGEGWGYGECFENF